MCCCSSGMVDLKELSLVSGKAAWMTYLVMALLSLHIYPYKFRKSSFWCFEHVLLDIVNCNGQFSELDYKEILKLMCCRTYTVWMLMVLSLMLLYFQLLLPCLIVRVACFLIWYCVWSIQMLAAWLTATT